MRRTCLVLCLLACGCDELESADDVPRATGSLDATVAMQDAGTSADADVDAGDGAVEDAGEGAIEVAGDAG